MDDRTRELAVSGQPAQEAAGEPSGGATTGAVNEAVPEMPPPSGAEPIGSIPGVHGVRVWARAQLTNWRLYLMLFLSSAVSVVVAVAIVPGLGFTSWQRGQFLLIGIVFGLLNALVKPVLHFIALRFILATYGVVVVAVNALLLVLLAAIMDETVTSSGALPVLVGGLLVGVLGMFLEALLGATPPVLDRDYKERHGLT